MKRRKQWSMGVKPFCILTVEIFLLVLVQMSLGSCQRDDAGFRKQLAGADILMRTDADSAFHWLCAMDSLAAHMPEQLRMEHLLLRCNAQNKADSLFSSDSLGLVLTRYFDSKGTAHQKMLAHYVLGCAYRDMGDSPSALQCFNEAVAVADTSDEGCQLYQLYVVYCQIANIYMDRSLADEALQAFERAARCAMQMNDRMAVYTVWSLQSDVFIIKGLIDKSMELKEKAMKGFREMGLEQQAAQTAGTCVEWLSREGRLTKAKAYMDYYVKNSGNFDDKGNAMPGREICNSVRTIYHAESGHLDSAFYYLHQIAQTPMNDDTYYFYCLLAADLYGQLEVNDSVAKYARLCSLWSDSIQRKNNTKNMQLLHAQFSYSRYEKKAMRLQVESLHLRNRLLQTAVFCLLFLLGVLLAFYLYVRFMKKNIRGFVQKYRARMNEKQQDLISSRHTIIDQEQKIEELSLTIKALQSEVTEKSQEITSLCQQLSQVSLEDGTAVRLQEQIRQQQDAMDELSNRCEAYKQALDGLLSLKKHHSLLQEPSVRPFLVQENTDAVKPSEDDWASVIHSVEEYYPKMKELRSKYGLSVIDYRICILIKLEVSLYVIMHLTDKSNAYLSTFRSRLYTKIHKTKGGAKDLDRYIRQL